MKEIRVELAGRIGRELKPQLKNKKEVEYKATNVFAGIGALSDWNNPKGGKKC